MLVEMTDHVLGGFSAESRAEAKIELELRGVEVRSASPSRRSGPTRCSSTTEQ